MAAAAAALESPLAGRAPEHVAPFQFRGADRGATHTARFAGPAVHICAWPTGPVRRQAMVVLGPHGDDLPGPEADLHQLDQVGPHGVEFGLVDVTGRAVRVDAVP